MSRSARAAGMIMGGIRGASPILSESEAAGLLASYARAGIRAYLFPGYLLRDPERLARLVAAAREAATAESLGRALVAIGGSGSPAFGLPPFSEAPTPLGLASSRSAAAARRAGLSAGLPPRRLRRRYGPCAPDSTSRAIPRIRPAPSRASERIAASPASSALPTRAGFRARA